MESILAEPFNPTVAQGITNLLSTQVTPAALPSPPLGQ